jgi:hypothetical protein
MQKYIMARSYIIYVVSAVTGRCQRKLLWVTVTTGALPFFNERGKRGGMIFLR